MPAGGPVWHAAGCGLPGRDQLLELQPQMRWCLCLALEQLALQRGPLALCEHPAWLPGPARLHACPCWALGHHACWPPAVPGLSVSCEACLQEGPAETAVPSAAAAAAAVPSWALEGDHQHGVGQVVAASGSSSVMEAQELLSCGEEQRADLAGGDEPAQEQAAQG